ncbi:hypothetical protein OG547_15805 [Streptomyces longwoodensis]|nr:hypothetical protein OG547_15805 [Streptomyces longwoodensis]
MDVIHRHFTGEELVPAFNDRHGARTALRVLDHATALADAPH